MSTDYYHEVQRLFQQSPILPRLGFDPNGVEVWGKGADHNDLLQIKKPAWRLLATDGQHLGYHGIEVHLESCRPGHWVIHCELFPRLGKKEKAKVLEVSPLLELKGAITDIIREMGIEDGWTTRLNAHLKYARPDTKSPSSLMVYTFELGLAPDHTPEEFVRKVLPIIEATSPVIDSVFIDVPPIPDAGMSRAVWLVMFLMRHIAALRVGLKRVVGGVVVE